MERVYQFTQKDTYFADLILPIPIPKLLTYRIPSQFHTCIARGSRVMVPLGTKKIVTGLVEKIHINTPSYATKDILAVLDEHAVVNAMQLQFFQWLAQYYLCTVGEVMKMALPSGLKLSSQSKMKLHPELDLTATSLSSKERVLVAALQSRSVLTYAEAVALVKQKNVHQLIQALLHKRVILLFEAVKEPYYPKKEKKVRLSEVYTTNQAALQALFKQLESKGKQLDVLLTYITHAAEPQSKSTSYGAINKKTLLQSGIAAASLQTLIKKQVLIEEEIHVSRLERVPTGVHAVPTLSKAQMEALKAIQHQFLDKAVVLLHGVTGSGKTEIYIQLIQKALQRDEQVLYLLPEIALTSQIVRRLQKFFGTQVAVYHSKYSQNERVEVWNQVLNNACSLLIGVRSAIFLPFDKLRLIIVDEEHEVAYKQWDTMPKYHARDASMALAKYHQAKVLLGSATPSLETYYNATSGKYGLVTLAERFGQPLLPEIILANVQIERQRKTLRDNFTATLRHELQKVLEQQGQAIIFQNRRGYAPYITCQDCAWVPMCTQCAVSLTYHQCHHYLCCHYCGYQTPMPTTCRICNSHRLHNVGFGTEKLEESLQLFFPQKNIQRMDLDTTRGKYSYEKIIESFERGSTDILVGTQMLTKGLDFGRVYLVGVLDVDRLLYFPDFRAHERCFQLLMQVSGRAGRRNKQGKVVIQTSHPRHPILTHIVQYDYVPMYHQELLERKQFLYPPYVRLIKLTLKHTDKTQVEEAATMLASRLQAQLGQFVLGPQIPLIAKLKKQYLMDIWVKIKKGPTKQLVATKSMIQEESRAVLLHKTCRKVTIIFDVDPI